MNKTGNSDVCVWDAFGAFWCESQQSQLQYGKAASPKQQGPVSTLYEGFSSSVKSAIGKMANTAEQKPTYGPQKSPPPVPSAEGFCGCMLP